MARTASTMTPLGSAMPTFSLPDAVTGGAVSSTDFDGAPAILVAFICNHCPLVRHIRGELAALGKWCAEQGVAMVAINSNDVDAYPDDAPPRMAEEARDAGYVFPYLFDETQEVAKAFGAACTPDFFLYDRDRRLVYRGQLDDSRPGNGIPVTGSDLRAAISATLSGAPVSPDQKPSIGCNIKWRGGG